MDSESLSATEALNKHMTARAASRSRRQRERDGLIALRSSIESIGRESSKKRSFDMSSMISAANEVEQTSCAFPSIEWDLPSSDEFQAPNGTAGTRNGQQLVLDSSIAGSRNGGYGASLSGSLRSSAGKKRRRRSGYNRIIIPKSLQFALSSLASSSSSLGNVTGNKE
jgi:hypothetical protein